MQTTSPASQHYKSSLRTLAPVGPVKSYRNFWEALSIVDEAPNWRPERESHILDNWHLAAKGPSFLSPQPTHYSMG